MALGALILSRGRIAMVDGIDFERLSKYKWTYSAGGYAYRMEHGKRNELGKRKSVCYLLHREVLNAPSNFDVDHINGNKLDNRRENLRLCTPSQNAANRKKQKNNTSGFKGVYWHKQSKKWHAGIHVMKKHISLGLYSDPKNAALAYNIAVQQYFNNYGQKNII